MITIDLHQTDAFTDQLFGGNPAGVVTNADGLTDEAMANIAREMNLSETAFVMKPTSDNAEIKLRYFTCGGAELDFCGHATIAAVYELARLQQYNLGKKATANIRVENGAGILTMSVLVDKNKNIKVRFVAPGVKMEQYHLQGQAFTEAFGMSIHTLRSNSLILIDSVLRYLYIPVTSLAQLGDLRFDSTKISKNFKVDNIVAFCLYTPETFAHKADLHARVTCPLIGIDEDPFTGSTQSGLLHAAKAIGAIDTEKQIVTTEQGHFMKRPSSVEVTHNIKEDTVLITANAVHVFSTQMEIKE